MATVTESMARKIREWRMDKGLSARAMSLDMGFAQNAVLNWENNPGRGINKTSLARLCKYMDITVDELMGEPKTVVTNYDERTDEFIKKNFVVLTGANGNLMFFRTDRISLVQKYESKEGTTAVYTENSCFAVKGSPEDVMRRIAECN